MPSSCPTPPHFKEGKPAKSYEVMEGHTVEVFCSASCGTHVEIDEYLQTPWRGSQADGSFVRICNHDSGTEATDPARSAKSEWKSWRINQFQSRQAGDFVCEARNGLGKTKRTFSISVKRKQPIAKSPGFHKQLLLPQWDICKIDCVTSQRACQRLLWWTSGQERANL